MNTELTELVFILDRSGSMGGLESDTIGGFNGMIAKQKVQEKKVNVTTILFDDEVDIIHDRFPVEIIEPLTEKEYFVRGCTALLDAVGTAIEKMENVQKHLPEDHRAGKIIFVITTDGLENSSEHFTQAQMDFARRLIPPGGPVIAVGPSANWIGKTWPAQNFIETLRWMTGPDGMMPGARVAVFAAPGEEQQAFPVLQSIPAERCIDGIAKGTPGEVAAALSLCDFYIGNDSGLMHAAAAAGIPTLGLFGPSYPHLYGPWGDHAGYIQTPKTFDELTDYEGYAPGKLTKTLMDGLSIGMVMGVLENFEPLHERLAQRIVA